MVYYLFPSSSEAEENLHFLIPSSCTNILKKRRNPHNCYKEQMRKSQKMKAVTTSKGGGSWGIGVTEK